MNPKILLFDVETAPVLAWLWRTGKQYVSHDQIRKGSKFDIICICYKWAHEAKIHSLDWGVRAQNSAPMISKFGKLVESADLVVAHNADRFDIKQINTQRLLHDQPPLAWPTSEDTLKQFRKIFALPSYRLDYLSKLRGGPGKNPMTFDDWIAIVERKDPAALKKMLKYCAKDVAELQRVYDWAKAHFPVKLNAALARENRETACPRCASAEYHRIGYKILAAGRYRRFQCLNCAHVWRSSKRA